MVCLQSVLGSLLILGWTCRLMQRSALKAWWRVRRSHPALPDYANFDEFAAGCDRTRRLGRWPGLIAREGLADAVRVAGGKAEGRPWRELGGGLMGSLFLNLRMGVQGFLGVMIMTLPGGVLWWFSWYAGWNNSFHKGYEHAAVGPAIGLLGIGCFIGAMLYVPMAQARHAVSGEWKRFFEFKLVWNLVRGRWAASAGLAALYAVAFVPVTILVALPMFLPQINPGFEQFTPEQARAYLARHGFWIGLWVLPAWVALRVIAARIYASALLQAVRRGAVIEDQLAAFEWHALERLGHLRPVGTVNRRWMVRVVTWAGTKAGRLTFAVGAMVLWFAVVAQVYVGQFLNYRGGIGWIHQPLIQIPWLQIMPPSLHNPLQDLAVASLILGLGWGVRRVTRRRPRMPGRTSKN
jgi:hypothetical protein